MATTNETEMQAKITKLEVERDTALRERNAWQEAHKKECALTFQATRERDAAISRIVDADKKRDEALSEQLAAVKSAAQAIKDADWWKKRGRQVVIAAALTQFAFGAIVGYHTRPTLDNKLGGSVVVETKAVEKVELPSLGTPNQVEVTKTKKWQ